VSAPGVGSRVRTSICTLRSVTYPDLVSTVSFWSDPEPDIWDRIRGYYNWHIFALYCAEKFYEYLKIWDIFENFYVLIKLSFKCTGYRTGNYKAKNFVLEKVQNFYGPGSGSESGSSRFENSNPDKNRPDPQHWRYVTS
jgi:hypothetical protein